MTRPEIEKLRKLKQKSLQGGGPARVKTQKDKGKLTARERIELLMDPGSFVELDALVVNRPSGDTQEVETVYGDGVVTGHGTIEGRDVFVFSQDFTVFGGSLGKSHAEKICKVMDLAVKAGHPLVGLNGSGGARIQEGVVALGGYADIFLRNTLASGVIPQISAILGPCAGGAVYSPAITDFVFMVEHSSTMYITGPSVLKTVTKEEVSHEELGCAGVHNSRSVVAHFMAAADAECLAQVR